MLVIMLQNFAIMLNYAQAWWESYYAQNYAGIMCQGLTAILEPPFSKSWIRHCIQPIQTHIH